MGVISMTDRTPEFWMYLQSAALRVLNTPDGRLVWTSGQWSWLTEVHNQLPLNRRVEPQELLQSVWALIRQGLAYVDTSREKSGEWK